ncbi:DUF2917 domain-containing protein [Burkholderia sp. 22PA0106]|uniref:DUF2917 domain-containing protein n=1 Tax=Burkholderia sp. 22PA0106 TaxID=3237371 RepID=UPI0039C07FE9
MREISTNVVFEIQAGETVPMVVAHSTRLTVQGATVWATRSEDVDDYFLAPGATLRLRRGERLWLGVEGPASAQVAFSVVPSPCQAARSALKRLANWVSTRLHDGWRVV